MWSLILYWFGKYAISCEIVFEDGRYGSFGSYGLPENLERVAKVWERSDRTMASAKRVGVTVIFLSPLEIRVVSPTEHSEKVENTHRTGCR